ncbi:MAG: flagellar M-ring protein FliF C-terminal domain-containing protein [Caldilineaceae bacterium]
MGSVIRSSSREEESWEGTGSSVMGGITGVDANAPADDATYQTGEGTSGVYNRRNDTINYEVSKEVRSRTVQPGSVERISVAVLMDESLPEEQTDAIKTTVAAALGLSEQRSDVIEVQRIPFDISYYEQELAQFKHSSSRTSTFASASSWACCLGWG